MPSLSILKYCANKRDQPDKPGCGNNLNIVELAQFVVYEFEHNNRVVEPVDCMGLCPGPGEWITVQTEESLRPIKHYLGEHYLRLSHDKHDKVKS